MSSNIADLSIAELEQLIAERKRTQQPPRRVSSWSSRFLLLLEVVAFSALALVGVAFVQNWLVLREQPLTSRETTAQTTEQPLTMSRGLDARAALPSGGYNVPERYRAWVQPLVPVAVAPPSPQAATRIVIPSIKVDAPVVEGTDWEALKRGVGHHIGSVNPGERGNLVLAGHNDVYGEIFRYLDRMKAGDEIIVYTKDRRFRYIMTNRRIVEPTAVEVMTPTTEPTATLISCYPYLIDTQRIVVFARLSE